MNNLKIFESKDFGKVRVIDGAACSNGFKNWRRYESE